MDEANDAARLLDGAGSTYLGHLLDAAVSAPGASADPASAVIVTELLGALATAGDADRIERALAVRADKPSSFEVRSYAPGSLVPSEVVQPANAAAAVLAAFERCETGDEAVEVVADDGEGLTRAVLSRAPGGLLRFRFADMTSYHQSHGDEVTLEQAVASWDRPAEHRPSEPVDEPSADVAAQVVEALPSLHEIEATIRQVVEQTAVGVTVAPPNAPPTIDVAGLATSIVDRLDDALAPLRTSPSAVADHVFDRIRHELHRIERAVTAPVAPIVPFAAPVEVDHLTTALARARQAVSKAGEHSRANEEAIERLSDLVLDMESRVAGQVAQGLDVLREEIRHLARLQTAELEALRHQVKAMADRRPASDPKPAAAARPESRTREHDSRVGAEVIDLRNSGYGR